MRIARPLAAILSTDRLDDAFRMGTVAAFASLFAVPLLACVAIFIMALALYEAPTPEEMFDRVVGVDVGRFEEVEYHGDGGLDYSHYFRFEFSDAADLDAIIEARGLSRTFTTSSSSGGSGPKWYAPDKGTPRRWDRQYTHRIDEQGVTQREFILFVDDVNQVGYFEQLDF